MSRSTIRQAILFCALAGITAVASNPVVAEQVYKWVDEKGNVHFGDKPPAKGAEQITVDTPAPQSAPTKCMTIECQAAAMEEQAKDNASKAPAPAAPAQATPPPNAQTDEDDDDGDVYYDCTPGRINSNCRTNVPDRDRLIERPRVENPIINRPNRPIRRGGR